MTHDVVVFDLDGTLVDLDVDWDAVAAEVAAALRERGVTPPESLWGMLEAADAGGHRTTVERVIASHEREGAVSSERLPAADTIPGRGAATRMERERGSESESGAECESGAESESSADRGRTPSVGVCSLNCEAACRIALDRHDIDGVDVVVGRDTVDAEKPDPEPLLETVRRLDGDPAATLFVGDSDRDERTAERAGIDYSDVSAWLRAYQ